ncbi:hypothetical protein SBRCBS47491_009722 [Sporothrix bragantina]|uniref:DUF7907 domain-containing protein n=1 Tax=Sporothrix bragantina TaxID=671064 RepID=A0ABP0CZK2_9PEZI
MPRSTFTITLYVAVASAILWAAFGCPTPPTPLKNYITSVANDNNNPFVLQTKVKNGGDTNFDNLYVFAYHTGAGLNDAMLRTEAQSAVPASAFTGGAGCGSSLGAQYFAVLFQIGGSPYELMPATGYTPYSGLNPVHINVNGAPPSVDNAFYFDENKLIWTSSANSSPPSGFYGWLACQSVHPAVGTPNVKGVQLFYRTVSGTAPAGCADVDLVAIY